MQSNRYMAMANNQQHLVGSRPHQQMHMAAAMPNQALIHMNQNNAARKALMQKGATQSLVEGEKKDAKTLVGYAAAFTFGYLAS